MNEKSEVHTDKALELNPGFHTAIANKGIALTRRGMLYDAYNYFTKSIRLNPTSTSTEYTNLSEIYLIIDEDELSDEYLFKAIKNSPNVVSTYRRGFPIMLIRKKSEQAKDIQNLFATNIANKDDIIILNKGAHGFKILKNVEMLEIKQGLKQGDLIVYMGQEKLKDKSQIKIVE